MDNVDFVLHHLATKIFLSLCSLFVLSMKKIIVILFFTSLVLQGFAQSREVPFTLDDRDRIIKLEEKLSSNNDKIESLRNEMNAKFDAIESKMDTKFEAINSKIETLYWGFGIFIAISLFTLGYIIWDRRTALYPVQDKTRNLEEQVNKLMYVTREQAKKDPAIAELLKIAGLL